VHFDTSVCMREGCTRTVGGKGQNVKLNGVVIGDPCARLLCRLNSSLSVFLIQQYDAPTLGVETSFGVVEGHVRQALQPRVNA